MGRGVEAPMERLAGRAPQRGSRALQVDRPPADAPHPAHERRHPLQAAPLRALRGQPAAAGGRGAATMSVTQTELKRVRALHQKKYRMESGHFLVQGRKVVEELLGSRFAVDAL